jgi:hypothetical protein
VGLVGLLDFIINVVGLVIVVSLIFLALEQPGMAPDEIIKKIARYAVGGAAVLAFIIYCAAVFGGVAGGAGVMHATPASIIEFAIGLIVLIVVVRIIGMVVAEFAPANLATIILFVVGAIAIIVILYLAEKALFGGGLGLIPNFGGFGAHQQPAQVR